MIIHITAQKSRRKSIIREKEGKRASMIGGLCVRERHKEIEEERHLFSNPRMCLLRTVA